MRRENNDWIIYLITGMLAILVTVTVILENLPMYEANVKETLVQPVFEVEGITSQGLVDINTADAATLMTVNGIGPVLADRIIAYREEVGDFASVEDLIHVKGIGEKTLAKIRQYVGVE